MSYPYTVYLSPEQEVQITSTQQLPLGTRGVTEDGRVYRYAQAGTTALAAHRLMQSAAESSFTTATDQRFYTNSTVGSTQVLIGGQATHTIGGSTVGMGTAANDYKDGFLFIGCTNSGDVVYNQYVRIKSHSALVSSTALGSNNYINLYPPGLRKTVSTDTFVYVKLIHNPYKKVLVNTVATSIAFGAGIPVGVTPCDVTASYYFWLQTWGPCLNLCEAGAVTAADKAGLKIHVATGGSGSFCAPATSGGFTSDTGIGFMQPEFGYIITAAPADSNYTLIMLQIAP